MSASHRPTGSNAKVPDCIQCRRTGVYQQATRVVVAEVGVSRYVSKVCDGCTPTGSITSDKRLP